MAERIKILRIQHNFVEKTNHKLLDELSRFPELEVHALCPFWGIESGNMRTLKRSPRDNLYIGRTTLTSHYATTFYIKRLATLIRRLRPDILNVHDEPYSLTSGQSLFYRRMFFPHSKVIFCSAQNIYKNFSFPFPAIERWMYREAAAGYGCCEDVKEVVRKKGFKNIFEIVPLGMDPNLFKYRQRDGRIEGRPFILGYVGQIVDEKGIFTLLQAFSALKGNVRLVMLGGGEAFERVEAAAQEAGIADRVELLDPVPHEEVPTIIDRFDTLVVPSETIPTWKEQFGRVIPEAFSMGIPVVGSDSGSIPEVVGDAGLIFREKDHEQLTHILQELIDHPEHLPEMSEKGIARVHEHFTWKRVAEMNRDMYHNVMSMK